MKVVFLGKTLYRYYLYERVFRGYLYKEDYQRIFYICSSSIQKTVYVGILYRFEPLKFFCIKKNLWKSSIQKILFEGLFSVFSVMAFYTEKTPRKIYI